MDLKAVYLLTQLFRAFKKQPVLLPEPTFNKFTNAVRDYIHKEKRKAKGDYKEDLGRFLNNGIKKCAENCYAKYYSGSEEEWVTDKKHWQHWVNRRMSHIREMIEYIEASGISRAVYYCWKDPLHLLGFGILLRKERFVFST